jgi:hypothetical protein
MANGPSEGGKRAIGDNQTRDLTVTLLTCRYPNFREYPQRIGRGHAPPFSARKPEGALSAHPILVNRPIMVTPKGVKLCRPSELVFDL